MREYERDGTRACCESIGMATRRTHLLRGIRQWATGQGARGLTDRQLLDRFVAHREEAAFAALVERHGPTVLRVCRRVLRDGHAAEDAFQATFLVLARKAGSITRGELLGNWLYGVACRAAARAREDMARGPRPERAAGPTPAPDPSAEAAARELCGILDEELSRLPERYRVPLELCYLDGRTRDQAARQLGWSLRTLERRLEQGRGVLQARLTRRGVTLSAGLLVAAMYGQAARAALPGSRTAATVLAAAAFVAQPGPGTGVSAKAAALAEGVLHGTTLPRAKVVVALVLA